MEKKENAVFPPVLSSAVTTYSSWSIYKFPNESTIAVPDALYIPCQVITGMGIPLAWQDSLTDCPIIPV